MLDETITLLKLIENRDNDGYDNPTTEETEVFAERENPFRNEFYAAMQVGRKVSLTFKIVSDDYSNQEQVRYNNNTYAVIRSYPIDSIYSRLVCEELE